MTAAPGIRGPAARRIRVLVVRQRLERRSAELAGAVRGLPPDRLAHRYVAHRLMLLTVGVDSDRWPAAFGLARRAGQVYRETSTVLHSNRAFGDVPEQLVLEWEQVADEVEAAAGAGADRLRAGSDRPG